MATGDIAERWGGYNTTAVQYQVTVTLPLFY